MGPEKSVCLVRACFPAKEAQEHLDITSPEGCEIRR
jgi:hypothetical protein